MKVTVFGIGYVGLVHAAVLASVGHNVCCVDIDGAKIAQLKQGIIPIFEPGLEPLVQEGIASGRLDFTTDAQAGVLFSDIAFIAVGTPPNEDGSADLQHVLAVAQMVAQHMQSAKMVVNKSTVPVGTADQVRDKIASVLVSRDCRLEFEVVSNPEFLKEGVAVADSMRPDRIVVGSDSPQVEALMRELYAPFNRNHDRLIFMDTRSAELTKYAANAMLATKISFMNEMANLAELVGADIEAVRHGIGSDERIGYHFIYPGCGFGGSCFPKDIKALISTSKSKDLNPVLLGAVDAVNQQQKHKLFSMIKRYFDGQLAGKTIALWGLSFKPNTDDMRDAPSRVLMEALWRAGVTVNAFDPVAMDECQRIYGSRDDLTLVGTKEAALSGADALVICTEWTQFKAPDFEALASQLNNKLIFDGRNLYLPSQLKKLGFSYFAIGRGDSISDHKR